MANKSQNRKSTSDVQKMSTGLNNESAEVRRISSFRDQRTKPNISLNNDSVSMDGRGSPLSSVRLRRSKDINSSQESLSSPAMNRPASRSSCADGDTRDDRHNSPTHNSYNGSRSSSPDKPFTLDGRHSYVDAPDSFLSPFVEHKRSSSNLEMVRDEALSRGTRERSFERSLDNILDKCSEKSLDLTLPADSWSVSAQEAGRSPNDTKDSTLAKAGKSEKKKSRWYNIMSTSYKSRSEDFKKMFKEVPKEERLIVDYSCALQKDILVQGRMYMSQNYICFYAKIFNWETMLVIHCKDITAITKEKTARVIPNAIQITTEKEKYFFTSFGARDKTYMMLFRVWQNALLDQPMSSKEMWTWIHYNYGDDLGLGSSDDDYVAPQGFEDLSEKLKEEINVIKEPNTDSEPLPANTEASSAGINDNEDTDALVSDEVFNQQSPSSPATKARATTSTTADPTTQVKSEIFSEFLDSTDESEGEFLCSGHDHLEKMYLDEVFNLSVDTVFHCLFTDSAFFRAFVGSRKTFDLNLPQWEEELDEKGNKVRQISYTLTLNNSIGPKTSPSTEKQICYSMSRPGVIYHVDCECCNGGIPYADSFYVLLRYCLTRAASSKCRIVVTGELKYRKHVLGMFKGMIEKSAVNGLTDYCRQLSVHLRREAEKQEDFLMEGKKHAVNMAGKKKLRRRFRKGHHGGTGDSTVNRQAHIEQPSSSPPSPSKLSREERMLELNADTLVRIVIVVLVLLLLFNAVLFYKLWSLESFASALYGMPSQESLENLAKYPRSQEEWSQLLQQQKNLHDSELSKWEEVLSASIRIVEQMKGSLLDLQKTLRAGSYKTPDT